MTKEDKSELKWTGERYMPEIRGTIALEHLHRYVFASENVNEKEVLDIASGEGYGSEILSRTAKHVYGVDIDEASVKHAQGKYKTHNLEYLVGSCTEIPLPDASVDIVVSFETIEHITDHEKMMHEVKRVLRPDGMLIISSPEKHEYNEENQHSNPYHLKELNKTQFIEILSKHFLSTTHFDQKVMYGSTLIGSDGKSPLAKTYQFASLPENIEGKKGIPGAIYSVVVCSDKTNTLLEGSLCEQPVWESDCIQNLFKENSHYDENNKLRNELIKNNLEIHDLKKSLSWKITFPLRKIRDIAELLAYRIKSAKANIN